VNKKEVLHLHPLSGVMEMGYEKDGGLRYKFIERLKRLTA